jgi:hypothetical protein
MMGRINEMKMRSEPEDEAAELMTGLENTLRVMMINATEMTRKTEISKILVETRHWAQRERFCADLIELITGCSAATRNEDQQLEGSTLGQSNTLLYGEGHGPPWKGRATPLVPAGKAGTRGSEQITSDCSQSVLPSCLTTGLDQRASHAELSQAYESAVSSSSSCLEGRVENHDRKLPMVTSALSTKSFLSNGSNWQLLGEVHIPEEEDAASREIGSLTEPESRLADAHEDEVENLLEGNGKMIDDRNQSEERERVRGVRKSLAERRIQWLDRRDRMRTTPTVVECFTKVKMGEMDENDARNEVACLEMEDAFRFEQLMGNVVTVEPAFRVFTWAMDWAFYEATNEDEIPLAVQMRLWEEHEMRKMQGEGIRSPFMKWRTRNVEETDEGLDLSRLYEELRSLGRNRHTRIGQEQEQVGRGWQPDEWIRTSVWMMEELWGGHQEGVAHLRSVGLRIYPRTYTA